MLIASTALWLLSRGFSRQALWHTWPDRRLESVLLDGRAPGGGE